ncbi:MAG TPA: M48 family metalloprotease [Solirubrobacteraceae bacterium]|jgi:Zn-dependent protease with chaperone function
MFEPDPNIWLDREGGGLAERGWVPLYLIHLLALIPTFTAMFFTSGLTVVFVTLIKNGHADWTAANWFAYGVPIAFILWATSGILLPFGAGRWLADSIGARHPTTTEIEAYKDAIDALGVNDTDDRRPKYLYVLDESDLNACVIADTIIVNRELLNTGYCEAIIAHELGHLNSMDVRISVAVNRLGAFARTSRALHEGYRESVAEQGRGSCIVGFFVLVIRACSGGLANNLMAANWTTWWRLREYAADDYAARLGQAEHLANLLETHGLLYDTPIRRVWASTHTHPPVALRIDRLRQHQAA